jgi:ectoine hydroxylase-related dioxygenase (phytanoyl-CoA dioxygenase family)
MASPSLNMLSANTANLAALTAEVNAFVEQDGYAIIRDVIDPATCAQLIAEVDRVEREFEVPFGNNDFEGFQTRRIFNLIARGPRFRELVLNQTMLSTIEALLGDDFLLSGTTSMHIGPGETNQRLHADDGMISLPRPHPATMITTLWALSEFTKDNGATRLIPGSHKEESIAPSSDEHCTSFLAEMPAGSVLVLHGSTWHGGGPNTTGPETPGSQRYGLSIQYVAGWCRQQQNLMLGTPREVVAKYPRRLQELIGYSMYRNVMGHVDRNHPLGLLGVDVEPEMVWEKMGDSE